MINRYEMIAIVISGGATVGRRGAEPYHKCSAPYLIKFVENLEIYDFFGANMICRFSYLEQRAFLIDWPIKLTRSTDANQNTTYAMQSDKREILKNYFSMDKKEQIDRRESNRDTISSASSWNSLLQPSQLQPIQSSSFHWTDKFTSVCSSSIFLSEISARSSPPSYSTLETIILSSFLSPEIPLRTNSPLSSRFFDQKHLLMYTVFETNNSCIICVSTDVFKIVRGATTMPDSQVTCERSFLKVKTQNLLLQHNDRWTLWSDDLISMVVCRVWFRCRLWRSCWYVLH